MHKLDEARQLMVDGNVDLARQLVVDAIKTNPNDIDAWQLAIALSSSDADRERATSGLKRAMEAQDVSQQPETPPNTEEKVYLKDRDVIISSTRAVIGTTTYSMTNVTSVSVTKKSPRQIIPIGFLLIGSILSCGEGLVMVQGDLSGWGLLIAGVILMGLSSLILNSLKPTYIVYFGSAGGERQALLDKDQKRIQLIVDAMNKAIVERG